MTDRLITAGGLVLRPWTATDAAAVHAAFSAPLMSRQTAEPVGDPAAAERWLAERAREWAEGTGFSWAVTDGCAVLGCVRVSSISRRHETGWVSYWTVAAAQGRGVAGTAARTVADWALGDLGLFRLELGHRTDNPASCGVAARAGFSVEGLQRAKLRYGNERHDVELHARLASDP
ncbi:GNAT family protein [Streptomyces sp. ACA25]|uniref:GNAT family N-acetyltransferase n=1 Tax=Streptomyces sp. ACA25 TaxID=3022596 RepID=UPI002307E189|nr:GNAT family protein [Streptomyces sp. ACA25]MDB1089178.1 GNAT family protein [Streptomyces sp. ACA25]